MFLVVLFLIRNKIIFKNDSLEDAGLAYGNEKIADFVNKDSDGDTVLDWEESLWGTDPLLRDTDGDGESDLEEKNKLVLAREAEGLEEIAETGTEIETETEKFSKELFATVASLNQTGAMDLNSVEKITDSISDQVKNPAVRKVFQISDIKVSSDNSSQAFLKYNNDLNQIYAKYPPRGSAMEILQEFIGDGENINAEALSKLGTIIEQTNNFLEAMAQVSVPSELAQGHLNFMNALQRLTENIADVMLYDTDPIVAMGAMNKYEENTTDLEGAIARLISAINSKLAY